MKKKTISILTAAVMLISVPATAMAMPSDVREGYARDEEIAEELQEEADAGMADGGDLIDDSELLTPVGKYYVATGYGNVRSWPNGTIIGQLEPGEKYYVSDRRIDCDWYKITGYVTNAYVYTDFLIPEEEYLGDRAGGAGGDSDEDSGQTSTAETLDLMMTSTANVNMRKEPNGEVVGVLKKGKEIHVIGHAGNDVNWYKCKRKKKTVYIYDDYLIPEFPQTMKATHGLNIRSGPGTDYPIIGSLYVGEKVRVSGEEDGWFRFKDPETEEIGYSSSAYMAAAGK